MWESPKAMLIVLVEILLKQLRKLNAREGFGRNKVNPLICIKLWKQTCLPALVFVVSHQN